VIWLGILPELLPEVAPLAFLVAFMQQGLEYCIGVAIIEYVSSNAVK
jgi:hypothetical protein